MNKRTLFCILAALSLSLTMTDAKPPTKVSGPIKFKSVKDIKSLKKGDKYILVCKECDTATVYELKEDSEAEALCHDGGSIHCESCKKKVTIKRTGPPSKKRISKEVKYLNAEGKECMVLIPLKKG